VAAFRIGRTEVTNAQYAQCVAAGVCTEPYIYVTEQTIGLASGIMRQEYSLCVEGSFCMNFSEIDIECNYGDAAYADHPVVCVSPRQAQAYAAWAGGRLPTDTEWTRACVGDDGRTYPWGNQLPDATMANYDTDADAENGGTTVAGSYPAGASPYGALDMAGNVTEWVDDGNFVARGGAFYYDAGPACGDRSEIDLNFIYFYPEILPMRKQIAGMGFRVVLPGAGTAAEAPAATEASGPAVVRGGGDSVLVPAGNGVAAFRIGRTEVTNAQYAQCVAAGACTVPVVPEEAAASWRDNGYPEKYWVSRYGDPAYAEHPVVWVTREQARAYAAWAGGRLPTDTEWTRACQGDDGRTYPWGEAAPDARLANFYDPARDSDTNDRDLGDTTPVGTYPAGASPYGALDMVGNVWEWVESDDGSDEVYIVRGGAFFNLADDVGCGARSEHDDGIDLDIVGFRVVSPGP
jgi:formylglycine-generating enzyme required for sulfatase activity